MKRTLTILLALLAVMSLLVGCGAKSAATESYDMAAGAAPMEAPAEPAPAPEYEMYEEEMMYDGEESMEMGATGAAAADVAQRKLIKNVDLQLETREFDKALEELTAMVDRLGGYIEYSDISGRSLDYKGEYYRRSASMTARIPVEKLTEATQTIDSLCNVTSRSESVNDITDQYYDVDGRLRTLRIEEERLLALLEKAEKLEDMLTIESHLSQVRYEIERLTGQLNRYDNQVSYSTVHMYLQEVVEYSDQKAEPVTFGQRVDEAFKNSLDIIREFGQGMVLFAATVLPVVLVYGGATAIVVLVLVKIIRSATKKKKAPKAEAAKPEEKQE